MNVRLRDQLLSLLLLAVLPAACRTTASGRLSMQASATGAASVSAQAQASASPLVAPGLRIRLVRGQLDYSGGVIDFAYDQATLEGERTFETLKTLRDFLQKHPQVQVRIEGHTDSRGSKDYNRELSGRRAATIRRWLTEQGIAEGRTASAGLGEDAPKQPEPEDCLNKVPRDPSPCEESWAINRRAVFQVTAGAETIKESPPAEVPASSSPDAVTNPGAHTERRRWLLGGHIGYAVPRGDTNQGAAIGRYLQGVVPLGLDAGLWLTERWALGVSPEYAPGIAASTCPAFDNFCSFGGQRLRLELWTEFHSSTGPGPEFWLGLGAGLENLSLELSTARGTNKMSRPSFLAALRLGIDFHASAPLRIGPYVEAAVGQYPGDLDPNTVDPKLSGPGAPHGWLTLGLRMAFDFFR